MPGVRQHIGRTRRVASSNIFNAGSAAKLLVADPTRVAILVSSGSGTIALGPDSTVTINGPIRIQGAAPYTLLLDVETYGNMVTGEVWGIFNAGGTIGMLLVYDTEYDAMVSGEKERDNVESVNRPAPYTDQSSPPLYIRRRGPYEQG